jgi:hypothetical protein
MASTNLADMAFVQNCQAMQIETVASLDNLKASVAEAKSLVHQTRAKVEELEESINVAESPTTEKLKQGK